MKTLLLMRHGDAPQARTDKERMLSDLGKRQCAQMSMHIKDLNVLSVITSDYQRAIDSANLVTQENTSTYECLQDERLRPMAHAKNALNFICDEFENLASDATLLVVCHMPLIAEMASLAIDGNLKNHYSFPCASMMKLTSDFASLGTFELLDSFSPEV